MDMNGGVVAVTFDLPDVFLTIHLVILQYSNFTFGLDVPDYNRFRIAVPRRFQLQTKNCKEQCSRSDLRP